MKVAYTPVTSTGILMPFLDFLTLGLVWEAQPVSLSLAGNLAQFEAKAVGVDVVVAGVTPMPIRQGFAWSKGRGGRIILGQVNFFMTFNICFYRGDAVFEISMR